MNLNNYNIVRGALDSGEKCPCSGLIIDVVDFDGVNFAYRLYRSNFEEYSDNNKSLAFEWIKGRAKVAMDLAEVNVGLEMAEDSQKAEEEHGRS